MDNIDSLYDVGIALGQLHRISAKHQFTHRPTLNVQDTITQAADDLKNCPYIPKKISASLFLVIEEIKQKIASVHNPDIAMIAIHGDAHASNILLKDEQPYWVDFDDAKMGPAVQDIWMLLNGSKSEQQLQLSMILEGYQEEFEFDVKELSEIEVLRSIRIINYVSWINNRWQDPAFSRNFPWFITDQYWKELLQSLQQQLILLNEEPFSLQPQY